MDIENESSGTRDLIRDKIREIEENAPGGGYIYRGQSDTAHTHVTSTLYRKLTQSCPEFVDANWLNMNLIQKEELKDARQFAREDYSDKEMLSFIQHYSGDTNLIDFTQSYHVALFFACYRKCGSNGGKDGVVFLLDISKLKAKVKSREEGDEIEMVIPTHPSNLVAAQKSVFIQSLTGIIPNHMMKCVTIPLALKQPILSYLEAYYSISLPAIYNDLHGHIRNRKEHAIEEFRLGLAYSVKSNNAQLPERKKDASEEAIKHYNKVIHLDPEYVAVYNNRGLAKANRGDIRKKLGDESGAISDYKDAIRDYDKSIELDPKYVMAYNNRGLANANCGNIKKESDGSGAIIDYKDAIRDYGKAIELDLKYVMAYNNRGNANAHCGDIKKKSGDESGAIIDYKDAIRDYDKAIDLDSEYAAAYNNRGNVRGELGDNKGAIRDYDKAIDLDSEYAMAYNNRGNTKDELGDYKGAISDCDKAIDLDPEYVNAYYNRGLAKENLGGRENLEQALADFEHVKNRALQLNLQDLAGATQEIIERVTAELKNL